MKMIDKICRWENLLEAFYNAAQGKWKRNEVSAFYADLGGNLEAIQDELKNGTYEVGHYQLKYIYEKKKRLIMILPFRDRVIQWSIYNVMYQWLDNKMMFHSYGSRKGKGSHKAVLKLQSWCKRCYEYDHECRYLKLDISKFFYRIDHKILIKILRRYYDDEMMDLLIKIIDSKEVPFGLPRFKTIDDVDKDGMLFDVGMPVGNLLSQLFANVYLNELDQYCKHTLKIKYYIRYMDDIIILCDDLEKIHFYLKKIKVFLYSELKLDLNKKTCIGKIKSGITFLSRRVYPYKVKLTNQSAKHIKKMLMKSCKQYADCKISFKEAQETFNSYYGEMKYVECDGLKKWISENIIYQRNRDHKLFKQPIRMKGGVYDAWCSRHDANSVNDNTNLQCSDRNMDCSRNCHSNLSEKKKTRNGAEQED